MYSNIYEYEADLLGMYLMKRAGYNTENYIQTIKSLPQMKSSWSKDVAEFITTHPVPKYREESLRRFLPQMEKAFETKYSVEKTTLHQKKKYVMNSIRTSIAFCYYALKNVF